MILSDALKINRLVSLRRIVRQTWRDRWKGKDMLTAASCGFFVSEKRRIMMKTCEVNDEQFR